MKQSSECNTFSSSREQTNEVSLWHPQMGIFMDHCTMSFTLISLLWVQTVWSSTFRIFISQLRNEAMSHLWKTIARIRVWLHWPCFFLQNILNVCLRLLSVLKYYRIASVGFITIVMGTLSYALMLSNYYWYIFILQSDGFHKDIVMQLYLAL